MIPATAPTLSGTEKEALKRQQLFQGHTIEIKDPGGAMGFIPKDIYRYCCSQDRRFSRNDRSP